MLVGDLCIWFVEHLAGIKCDSDGPGFKKIIIKPIVVGDLTWVKANYNSIHGTIESSWRLEKDEFRLDVTVPANTTATVYVPAKDAESVMESRQPAASSEGVGFLRMEKGLAVFAVDSGQYQFVSKLPH